MACTKWQSQINQIVVKSEHFYIQVQLPSGRNTGIWVPALPLAYDFEFIFQSSVSKLYNGNDDGRINLDWGVN